MAYNRLVVSGTLGGGADIFSVGFNYTPDLGAPVITPTDLNLWAAACATYFAGATLPNLKAGLSTSGTIREFRTYYHASDTGPATTVGTASASIAGTGTANQPLPTSFVLSLRTALAGRRARGRAYWPALSVVVQAAGTFSSGFMSAAPTEARNMIVAFGDAASATDLRPVVVSKVGAGQVTPVTQVAIGNVPDTQRRRRNALVETYSTAAI